MVSTSCSTALLFMRLQRICLNCYNAVNDSSRLLNFCYMCAGSQFFITLVRASGVILLTHWKNATGSKFCIMGSNMHQHFSSDNISPVYRYLRHIWMASMVSDQQRPSICSVSPETSGFALHTVVRVSICILCHPQYQGDIL